MTLQNFHLEYFGQYNIALYFSLDYKKNRALLLYSWILPVKNDEKKWLKRESGPNFITVIGSFDAGQIKQLWVGLLSGKTFELAARDAGIQLDIQSPQIEIIKSWVLPVQDYTYRPQCIYCVKDEWDRDQELFCSPTKKSLAKVETLFCLKKEEFFGNALNSICDFLKNETGIPFLRAQVGRLGNVEWYTLPSVNIYEKSYVHVQIIDVGTNKQNGNQRIRVTIAEVVPIVCTG